ncbi:hypothetical protein A4D02_14620 [Niastella koreensis]|uniref:Uncharacterized protein n=2 Tax=Niastella koreensis TaxID=354356 RepID=G8T889_NIAKG|nr:hypothetical protein [Niastella koreensis]AEV98040.1 hypothetical protein Niako_1674 [Niastella koreensis GR20-10]OQP40162.1 hypothetical protein A4D02_14620 [Niastella koreensis]
MCTHTPEPRYVNKTIPPGFVREVPDEYSYKYINEDANSLQLDSLEAGYDSLQIRIWLGHSLARVRHVVILKYKDQDWTGQLVSFSDETGKHHPVKKLRKVSPRSGWRVLIDSLFKLGIVTLPHDTAITGYSCEGGTDGISYDFEIATSTGYRFYRYDNPAKCDNFWQPGNVLQIASLLENEFDFKYTR